MNEFKIRCSSIGKIMTKPGSETLPETAKSYCDLWIKGQVYNREKKFTNKYTEKGCIVEDNSIDYIAEQLGYGFLLKNEIFFEDEFMKGTPDIIPPEIDVVIDAKNSWDWTTFPLLGDEIPNTDYYWQLQGYMSLTQRSHAKLVYVLSDTPLHLIEREAKWHCINNGYEELDIDILNEFIKQKTYPDIPDKHKIKAYGVPRSDEDIERIKSRVLQCRDYINEQLKTIP